MSYLSRMVDLYADEVIAPLLDRVIQQMSAPSMAQIQLLYRRAQSVRTARDLFRSQGPVINTQSFEAWLEHRIALATRRDAQEDKRFFTTIRDHLFGDQPEALRRATNKRLTEAGILQPLLEQRTEVQLLLFRRWLDGYYTRLRHAHTRSGPRNGKHPHSRNDQAFRSNA